MSERPKVLAGILYSGESTLSRAIGALESQQDIDLRILLIGRFSEWEAHRRLYRSFNETGSDADLFVKVDADMVILHDRLLAITHAFVADRPTLDMVTVPVDDWLSGTRIYGMHFWRPTVRWLEDPPPLRTDGARTTVRQHLKLRDPSQPLVLHAPEPTEVQAARYAARRVLKAMSRPGRLGKWRTVEAFVDKAIAEPAPTRRLGLAAALLAIEDPAKMQEFVLGRGAVQQTLDELRNLANNKWEELAEHAPEAVRSYGLDSRQESTVVFETSRESAESSRASLLQRAMWFARTGRLGSQPRSMDSLAVKAPKQWSKELDASLCPAGD